MAKFILLAETGADIPAEIAKEYGIYIAPMHVTFGSETRDDGSFDVSEVFSFYESTGTLTKTSGCTPEDFETVLAQIRAEHPDSHIIYMAYSASTTCSYQSCVIASEGMDNISLIDTKQVSAGQCLAVLKTARYLRENPDVTVEQAVKFATEISEKVHMGFFPGDLAYLKAGGRVSNAAYLGAKILSLNPLIEIRDGRLEGTKKYRGKMDKVAVQLYNEFVPQYNLDKKTMVFVYSKGLGEQLKKQLTDMAKQDGFEEVMWIMTGGVVSTHSGPAAFGVCGISE
ncbi:MAG: DegV family EDD domain-containing protein [Oscillospiraceae bacterium]|nr:DegV family EDD domain-containing protein [Oscillospiraceae bacterium]